MRDKSDVTSTANVRSARQNHRIAKNQRNQIL